MCVEGTEYLVWWMRVGIHDEFQSGLRACLHDRNKPGLIFAAG